MGLAEAELFGGGGGGGGGSWLCLGWAYIGTNSQQKKSIDSILY